MTPTFADLAKAQYILLTTFTKDGRPKPTPIWAAADGDRLLVITEEKSWKVKRIRNTPRVTLAICAMRGRPTSEAVEGTAAILDKSQTGAVYDAIGKRYGIVGKVFNFFSKLRGGMENNVGLELRVAPEADRQATDGTVLIPIPDRDFDPTEVAVSWRVLTRNGHRVVFATESGAARGRPTTSWSPAAGWTSGLRYRCWALSRWSGWRCGPTRTAATHTATCCDQPSFSIRSAGLRPPSTTSTRCCCPAAIAPAECAATSTATYCSGWWWTPSRVG